MSFDNNSLVNKNQVGGLIKKIFNWNQTIKNAWVWLGWELESNKIKQEQCFRGKKFHFIYFYFWNFFNKLVVTKCDQVDEATPCIFSSRVKIGTITVFCPKTLNKKSKFVTKMDHQSGLKRFFLRFYSY